MSIEILFVDPTISEQTVDIDLQSVYKYGVESCETAESAEKLLEKKNYGIVVIEPYDSSANFKRDNDNLPPLIWLMRGVREMGLPIIVTSNLEENRLEAMFGIKNSKDYFSYVSKPYEAYELNNKIRKVYSPTKCQNFFTENF